MRVGGVILSREMYVSVFSVPGLLATGDIGIGDGSLLRIHSISSQAL